MLRDLSRRQFVGTGVAGAAAWLAGGQTISAAPVDGGLGDLLGRDVLPADRVGRQVRSLAASLVPAMPEVDRVEIWEAHAEKIRQEMFDRVIFVGEAKRWRQTPGRVEWTDTIEQDDYRIRKVRYEVLPGYWMPGLLYEPHDLQGNVPLIYNTHGHVGSGGGKARAVVQYRCINFVKRGMLAFTSDWPDIGQLQISGRHYRMHQLELCGTSGVAPFYLTLERALDFLLEHPHVDSERVCVNGLSGGGWQTIFFSALDQRVTLVNPVAGHSSLVTRSQYDSDLGDGEQAPNDMGTVADYTHLTAMVAPRPQLLTFNANDSCCFGTRHALPPLMDAATPIYNLYDAGERLRAHNNMVVDPEPRGHNFGRENREALYRMIAEHFYDNDPHFQRQDLPGVEAEMMTYDDLFVQLPEDNHTFNTMARQLLPNVPHQPQIPRDAQALQQWQAKQRPLLREIVRVREEELTGEKVDEQGGSEGVRAVYWRLKLGDQIELPAVELIPPDVQGTVVLLADEGRAAAADSVGKWLDQQRRVVAIDPWWFGESSMGSRHALVALLVACVGERPLGIVASQTAATCRWLHQRDGEPAHLVALGERTSTIALVAAAIETEAVAALEMHKPLDSFKQIIERDKKVTDCPEAFCFGLLEHFDVPQLQALVAPRAITRHP